MDVGSAIDERTKTAFDLDGYAWYRVRFLVPERLRREQLVLLRPHGKLLVMTAATAGAGPGTVRASARGSRR